MFRMLSKIILNVVIVKNIKKIVLYVYNTVGQKTANKVCSNLIIFFLIGIFSRDAPDIRLNNPAVLF